MIRRGAQAMYKRVTAVIPLGGPLGGTDPLPHGRRVEIVARAKAFLEQGVSVSPLIHVTINPQPSILHPKP